MKTVAVLFGGQSSEYQVSLMSATSVISNIDDKFEKYLVGITKDGKWYHYSGKVENIENGQWINDINNQEVILAANRNIGGFYNLATKKCDKVDVVFPVLHGNNGEDGTIQGLCQLAGLPIVSDSLTSCGIAMDKEYTHIVCEAFGIKMAKYHVVRENDHENYKYLFEELVKEFGLPMYVKPAREGSSFGAHKIKDYDDFVKFSEDAFSYDFKIIYEEFIDGTEVGCGVLGDGETGKVYEVAVETEMYGFDEKYNGYKTNIYVPAKTLSPKQQDEINELGAKIAKILGCKVFARIDFFNSSKGIIFNEANLIPGFTSHSLYPAMFTKAGYSFKDLITKLIETVLKY